MITCVCGLEFEPTVDIHDLTVSPCCGVSFVIPTGQRATAGDTFVLTADELKALRKARNRPRRVPA